MFIQRKDTALVAKEPHKRWIYGVALAYFGYNKQITNPNKCKVSSTIYGSTKCECNNSAKLSAVYEYNDPRTPPRNISVYDNR